MTPRSSEGRSARLIAQLHADLVSAYDEMERLEKIAESARAFLFRDSKDADDYSDLDELAASIIEYDDWSEANTPDHDPSACADCGTDTTPEEGPWEWYMVQHMTWSQVTVEKEVDYLCIGCLEHRLGRQLVPTDFTNAPINAIAGWGHKAFSDRTDRLLSRLTTP